MIVGLTGVFGSGKSTVARLLAKDGARVIDADKLAREVTAPGSEGLADIARVFGPDALDETGALNRAAMGARVFQDARAREDLNRIVHPRVRQLQADWIERYRRQGVAVIVLDVPLLFESGFETDADRVMVTWVAPVTLYERMWARRGLDRAAVDLRLAAQWSQDDKASRADAVIDNSGSLEDTRRQVRRVLAEWTQTGN